MSKPINVRAVMAGLLILIIVAATFYQQGLDDGAVAGKIAASEEIYDADICKD